MRSPDITSTTMLTQSQPTINSDPAYMVSDMEVEHRLNVLIGRLRQSSISLEAR